MTVEINFLKKITLIRQELNNTNLKKSGSMNIGSTNYKYFELSDIMQPIINLCSKYEVFYNVKIGTTSSKLIILDCNSDKSEVFEIEHEDLRILDTHTAKHLQSLGSKTTYLTRYLLMLAFQIAENDSTEPLANVRTQKNSIAVRKSAESDIKKKICNILDERRIDKKKQAEYLQARFPDEMKEESYDNILKQLSNE